MDFFYLNSRVFPVLMQHLSPCKLLIFYLYPLYKMGVSACDFEKIYFSIFIQLFDVMYKLKLHWEGNIWCLDDSNRLDQDLIMKITFGISRKIMFLVTLYGLLQHDVSNSFWESTESMNFYERNLRKKAKVF